MTERLSRAVRRLPASNGERRPDFGAHRKVESDGRDPDDFVLLAVEQDRSTEDVRIASESTLPEALAHDDTAMLARPLLVRPESAPERRLHAERSKEVGRDAEALNALGIVAPIRFTSHHSNADQPLEVRPSAVSSRGSWRATPISCLKSVVRRRFGDEDDAIDTSEMETDGGSGRR